MQHFLINCAVQMNPEELQHEGLSTGDRHNV